MANMEWIICQWYSEREWERERQNDSIVLKDLNEKWKRYTKYRNIEAAKQINKNKRFLYFIGWFENVWLTFPRRARIFFFFHLNVPLKFVAGDVKDAYSQNVWILFKGHTNIASWSSSTEKKEEIFWTIANVCHFFLDFNLKSHLFGRKKN